MPTGLLTDTWREYLAGKHDEWADSRIHSETSKIRKRVGYGLEDLALVGENLDKIGDSVRVLIQHTDGATPEKGNTDKREKYRTRPLLELVRPILVLLITLSQELNYNPRDWENWLKEAYETANPDGYAMVGFETIQDLDLDKLEAVFRNDAEDRDRDDLHDIELKALLDHGRIEMDEYIEAGGEVSVY